MRKGIRAKSAVGLLGVWFLIVGLIGIAKANGSTTPAILVTIAEAPGQQSSTVSGVAVFDFESLTTGRHSDVVWPDVGVLDELLVHEGYFGFGALDPSDGLNSRFNWNGWPGWSGSDPVVSATIITLDERSSYFGLYWSAGDGDDIIRFYDGDALVAEFSTQHVVQSAHLTAEYYGDPNHSNQWQPHLRYNHTEPYAYINFYGDANTKWDKVVLTQTHDRGSGFETDNLSSRVDPVLSNTDDVSSIGKAVASVSGTETTVISDTSTWSFNSETATEEETNEEETTSTETESTETESSETTSETETSESDTETEVETTESETYYGSEVLIANTKAIVQNYSGMPLSSGDQIEYTVTFSNTGTDAVSNLTLTGLVPDNTTYVVDTLTIDDLAYSFDPTNGMNIGGLDAGTNVVIKLIVEVNASLPADAVWITSSVNGTYDENLYITIVADNDVQGHCGIREDGFDDLLDNGWDVGDDDPTKLPLLQGTTYEDCLLAYEDLKNKGWNDWDMNDIILRIFSFYVVNGANQITHLSVHQQIIARGAGMDSKLFITLPHNGMVDWHATYSSSDGTLESVESDVSMDGPLTVRLWESSKDALPPFTELKHTWGAANTERFDSTGEGKIAVLNLYFHDPASNPLDTYSISPHDTWIRASSNEEIHLLEYDSSSSQVVLNPASPLFGRSLPFGAVFDIDWVWPAEGQPIWLSHPDYANYIISGGAQYEDWYLNYNKWRVWWDDEGMMNNGLFNNASSSIYWNTYVETWSD